MSFECNFSKDDGGLMYPSWTINGTYKILHHNNVKKKQKKTISQKEPDPNMPHPTKTSAAKTW